MQIGNEAFPFNLQSKLAQRVHLTSVEERKCFISYLQKMEKYLTTGWSFGICKSIWDGVEN